MSEVQPHIQRVIDERTELAIRAAKLKAFFDTPIFKGLDAERSKLMREQHSIMDAYVDVLDNRLMLEGIGGPHTQDSGNNSPPPPPPPPEIGG